MRFWVTDKGCSAAFRFSVERTSRFCGADFTFLWSSVVSRVVVGFGAKG